MSNQKFELDIFLIKLLFLINRNDLLKFQNQKEKKEVNKYCFVFLFDKILVINHYILFCIK